VYLRGGRAETLDAELMRLAIAALLRTLVAEERAAVVELERQRLEHVLFEHRAHHRRREFGAQRERSAAAVVEGVHLFVDDVGAFANRADEHVAAFKDRRPDFAI